MSVPALEGQLPRLQEALVLFALLPVPLGHDTGCSFHLSGSLPCRRACKALGSLPKATLLVALALLLLLLLLLLLALLRLLALLSPAPQFLQVLLQAV